MGAWILSISGVICLGILLEIVLPDGKVAKYVKGAFSLLVVLAIAAPLPALVKKNFNINIDTDIFKTSGEEYVDAYIKSFKEKAQDALTEKGCVSSIEITVSGGSIEKVSVTVYDMTLSGEEIVATTAKALSVPESKINVIYRFFENRNEKSDDSLLFARVRALCAYIY